MAKFSDNRMAGIVHDSNVITLGTLAANTSIISQSNIDSGRESGFRLLKTEYHIEVGGKTDNEGPIIVGLSHNLSVAEIKGTFEADPASHPGIARPENEAALRPVWPLFSAAVFIANNANSPYWRTFKPLWSSPEGSSMNWFAHNSDSSALTTGAKVFINAKHFGVWLND